LKPKEIAMRLRWFAAAVLLLGLAAWTMTAPGPAIFGQNISYPGPRWEYRTIRLEGAQCSSDGGLNKAGQEGWELVSFSPVSVSFDPPDAQGSLLIRPAATGVGAQNNPQTADSFTGTIAIRMSQAHADVCQAVFKRLAPPAPGAAVGLMR
jgi:hypothetical protein